MEQDVLENTTDLLADVLFLQRGDIRVTVGENESVSVPPLGGFTVEVHVPRVENVGNSSHSL